MDKTVVITGGSSGIGSATAINLAQNGYKVKMVCRNPVKGELVREGVSSDINKMIEVIEGDLGTIISIKKVTSSIKSSIGGIAIFIHNAAIWPTKLEINEDGLEKSFVVNHLAPFIINHILHDVFKDNGTRVVQVSAGLYRNGKTNYDAAATGSNFSKFSTYATTKLLNLITTLRFAELWKDDGIIVNAIHPGVVKTNLLGNSKDLFGLMSAFFKTFFISPQDGSLPVIKLASNFDSSLTGKYYNRYEMEELRLIATDPQLCEDVWNQASKLARIEDAR